MGAEIRAWLETVASFGTFLTAFLAAWIAYKKWVKEETSSATPNRLVVFSTSHQTTELRATEEGLELFLHDTRPGQDKGLMWTIPAENLKDATVSVYDSKEPGLGLFGVGENHYDWYYTKRLFPTQKNLLDAIENLKTRSIELSRKKNG